MKRTILKDNYRVYLWIAAAYAVPWMLADLIKTPHEFFVRAINNIWLIGYLTVIIYILLEYTLPFLMRSWRTALWAPVLLFAHAMMHAFGFYGWRAIGIKIGVYSELRVHDSLMKGVQYHAPYSFFAIFFFFVLKHAYDYRKLKAAAQQLKIEKQEAELNYLKSQTNPHFLFNTLNNIYSLARDKSDRAPESILRLSKILRFVLYETSGEFIALEQELRIIHDYIDLEKLRYDESLRVSISHDVEDMKQAIPPLLLIPLVENAFKHGVSETRDRPFVDIHLGVNNRQLVFKVKNSAEIAPEEIRENIGLSNLRRQLELLFSEYSLTVEHANRTFTAILKINLASHV